MIALPQERDAWHPIMKDDELHTHSIRPRARRGGLA
jgi:hypothetical protein